MDEFGVLVESIGFKAQGRSTPLADLKSKNTTTSNGGYRIPRGNSGLGSKLSSSNGSKSVHNPSPINGSFDVDLDGVFQSFNKQKSHSFDDFGVFDDVFGGAGKPSKPSGGDGFDLDSVFTNQSAKSSGYVDDDIFGGMPGLKTSNGVKNGNGLGSIPPSPKQKSQVGDLLGNFGGMKLGSNGSRKKPVEVKKSAQEFDGLVPGFGSSSPSRNGENVATSWSPLSNGSSSSSANDPFVVLEQSPPHAFTSPSLFSEPVEQNTRTGSSFSSLDEFDDFVTGKAQNGANKQSDYLYEGGFETSSHDLDSFFSVGAKPSSGKSAAVDPVFDSLFQSKADRKEKVTPSSTSLNKKKVSASPDIFGDFSSMFGAPSSGEFQEINGESEERRRARLNTHMKTKQRMAKALEEKNRRDLQTQRDQEERHRVAEALDDNLKRWAAGKEGNLRALLSSLQHVLWPECGWKPVPLTDLITSIAVKKVYHKATLCVHPDKVQQKGANIQQKYIAEKVFDLLKEAWNKFNSEEL